MTDPCFVLDKAWNFIFLNQPAAFLLKREKEDLLGKNVWNEFREAVGTPFYQKYHFAVQAGSPVKFEAFYEPLDTWFEVNAMPFSEGLSVFFNNINDRKKAEHLREVRMEQEKQALEANELYFRDMADNAPVMIWTTDASGYCTYLNKQWYDFTGQSMVEGLGLGWVNAVHPEDAAMAEEAFLGANRKRITYRVEFRLKHYDGVYRYVIDSGLPRYSSQGEFLGFIGSVVDITDRKVSEILLKESEERLRLATESAELGTWDYYPLTGELIWSDKCKALYGLRPDQEVDFASSLQLLHPDDRHTIEKEVQRLHHRDSGGHYDVEYRVLGLEDKKERWVKAKGKAFYNEEGKAYRLIGTLLDITENRQSAERFRFLADAIPQIVWTAEHNGNVDYWNAHWYVYTGLDFKETKAWGWQKVIHPDDLPQTVNIWEESLKTGKFYQVEYRLLRGSDRSYRWHLGRALPMKDPWGNIIKWFGTCTDIHDRKLSEENLLRANQELSKINNDLDNFIYTASHDLKSPIVNLEGLLLVLKRKIQAEGEVEKMLHMMNNSVQRFKGTLRELTEISKVQKAHDGETEEVDLSGLWEDVTGVLQHEIDRYQARICLDLEETHISFSRKNLRSILYNLLSNALKYSSPQRIPLIRVSTKRAGDYTVLSFADNGMGFSSSKKNKVFGMFNRLHTHVEGSGVGLYIVKRMVENAEGRIEVESVPEQGATFKVYFKH